MKKFSIEVTITVPMSLRSLPPILILLNHQLHHTLLQVCQSVWIIRCPLTTTTIQFTSAFSVCLIPRAEVICANYKLISNLQTCTTRSTIRNNNINSLFHTLRIFKHERLPRNPNALGLLLF